MRRIAHLSDLHFGRTTPRLVEALRRALEQEAPDVIVISGDLTQRARHAEFRAARQFLDALPYPKLIIPGNHDLPLYSPERVLEPLKRFRTYISGDVEPTYEDEELVIVGLNTTRLITQHGRIRTHQVGLACERLGSGTSQRTSIVVTHHPFALPPGFSPRYLLKHAARAMRQFCDYRVELFLSGHLHVGHVSHSVLRYRIEGHTALIIQAGTAISTRLRGEANSWNLLLVDRPHLAVIRIAAIENGESFREVERSEFVVGPEGWSQVGGVVLNCSRRL